MPIEALHSDAYTIKELTLGIDAQGRYLSLICSRATAYVLCFSNGVAIQKEMLVLSERDLELLHGGGILEREAYRLQGVRRQKFDAMPTFRSFTSAPPEQIQVWSMASKADGTVVLYVPEEIGNETCYVPLRYSYSFESLGQNRRNNIVSVLHVTLADMTKYTEGALLYQVGDYTAIPLPRSYLNRDIFLRTEGSCQILVDDCFCGKYTEA